MTAFRSMFFNPAEGEPVQLVNNFRPVQDLHDRKVMSNDPAYDISGESSNANDDGSHGNRIYCSLIGFLVSICAMFF